MLIRLPAGAPLRASAIYFGKALPDLPMGHEMRDLFAYQLASGEQVDRPRHGDAALLRSGDHPHAGVWLVPDGVAGVLHALEGIGVIWSPVPTLRLLGLSRARYIQFHQEANPADASTTTGSMVRLR